MPRLQALRAPWRRRIRLEITAGEAASAKTVVPQTQAIIAPHGGLRGTQAGEAGNQPLESPRAADKVNARCTGALAPLFRELFCRPQPGNDRSPAHVHRLRQ